MADNDRLTTKKRRFALACMQAKDVRDAAKVAGVGEATAYRYLKDRAVLAEIDRQADILLNQVAGGFMSDLATARGVLQEVMGDDSTPPGVRVRAAKALLDTAAAFWEMAMLARRQADTEKRIRELEAHLGA